VRTPAGDLVWRFDRDGKKPVQAIPVQVATDMNEMMSHVVYEGTARRAQIEGVPAAGKTGTTNAFRDAWFVGYTGNFTAGVWFGNDDYSSTNRMTGGSLPAMTWRAIMVAAHQGVEVKDIPGVTLGKRAPAAVAAANAAAPGAGEAPAGPPPVLTRRGADILVRVEKLLDEAAKAAASTPPAKTTSTGTPAVESFAAATQGNATTPSAGKN
jgi:penicillin-binding protein 1A